MAISITTAAGLLGFLAKYRDTLPAEYPKLYAGSGDNFCKRYSGPQNALAEFGALDRLRSLPRKVAVVLAEQPTVVAESCFPRPARSSAPVKSVFCTDCTSRFAVKDGLGCDATAHFGRLRGRSCRTSISTNTHATCFNIKDKGLVVSHLCGHVGIVNSARQAQEVSGVKKIHALVGGFHLRPGAEGLHRAGGR